MSTPEINRNFFIQIRNSVISRNTWDNLNALHVICVSLNKMSKNERLDFINQLVNLDFLFHYPRFITSNKLMMQYTLKVTLYLMEHDRVFSTHFVDLLRAHFRAFLFMVQDTQNTDVKMMVDCVNFVQMMQERSLNVKLRLKKKNPLKNVSRDFYDGYRLALLRCHDSDVKSIYFGHLSQMLLSFIGKDSLQVQSADLCHIISTCGVTDTHAVTIITSLLVQFVLPNLNPENFDHQKEEWIRNIINDVIQRHFMGLKLTPKFLYARLFHIYFIIHLIEMKVLDRLWINENIIKFFLCHNGLLYLMKTIRDSIQTNTLLGSYLSKQLLSHILANMEIVYIDDTCLAMEVLTQAKPKYDQIISQLDGIWNKDFREYELVSGINHSIMGYDAWVVLVTCLYIGVTYVKGVEQTPVFINVVTLLEVAFIQDFDIPERLQRMMMEIYCATFWSVPLEIKQDLGKGFTCAEKYFLEYFTNKPPQTYINNPKIMGYLCLKINDNEPKSQEMLKTLLSYPALYLQGNIWNAFAGKETVLLNLLSSSEISSVVKLNITEILMKLDLSHELVNEIADVVVKCKDSTLSYTYLPIISNFMNKISDGRKEILTEVYNNHSQQSSTLSNTTRLALMKFFTKSIITKLNSKN